MKEERIQKIIARAGLASRRKAEQFLVDKRVRVNGKRVGLGDSANPTKDRIEIEGIGVIKPEPIVYIAMHKPANVVCTMKDPEGRITVNHVLESTRAAGKRMHEGNMPRVFPVGKLDYYAEGLLLLTNDGELANRLADSRHHAPKTYTVKVKGKPELKTIQRLRDGVKLINPNGTLTRPTRPAEVSVIRRAPTNTWVELTLLEGRNHQVKRMFQAVGHDVLRVVRTDFGGLSVNSVPPGGWRFLTDDEVRSLQSWATDVPSTEDAPKPRRRRKAPTPRKSSNRSAAGDADAGGKGAEASKSRGRKASTAGATPSRSAKTRRGGSSRTRKGGNSTNRPTKTRKS